MKTYFPQKVKVRFPLIIVLIITKPLFTIWQRKRKLRNL